MKSLTDIISQRQSTSREGIIERKLSNTRYRVKVGDYALIAISSRSLDLYVGQRVTMVRTSTGWMIVHSADLSSLSEAEKAFQVDFTTSESLYTIQAELDDDMNKGVTSFKFTDSVYLKVFTYPENLEITHVLSDGSISAYGSGTETLTETITFSDTDESSVEYPVNKIVSYSWLGKSLGNVTLKPETPTTIKAGSSGVGVLSITYITLKYRRYILTLGERDSDTWTVIDTIFHDDLTESVIINYGADSTTGETADYYLEVKDYCSETILSGVSIIFDGHSLPGQTGDDGKLYVGRLVIGSEHTVTINEPGYRSFTSTFTIPAPEEEVE